MTTDGKTIIVIPARMDSKRLPGKLLLDVGGKALLHRTFDMASKTNADLVVVASGDKEITDYCNQHQISFINTSKNIVNGTARCKQAIEVYKNPVPTVDIIIEVGAAIVLIKAS